MHGYRVVQHTAVVGPQDTTTAPCSWPEGQHFLAWHMRVELFDVDGIIRKHGIRDLVEELSDEVHGHVFPELLVDSRRPADG